MSQPDTVAIVPAAGAGLRMGGSTRKQYLELDGVPILIRSLRALAAAPRIGDVVVAAPADEIETVREMIASFSVAKIYAIVAGGETRQASVERGLAAAPATYRLVLVHDAVRPLVTQKMIDDAVKQADLHGGAVVATAVKDTLKRVVDGVITDHVEREGVVRIQTPQAFRRELLQEAYDAAARDRFIGSDESTLVSRIGGTVRVVEGDEANLKITTPDDLPLARSIVEWRRG